MTSNREQDTPPLAIALKIRNGMPKRGNLCNGDSAPTRRAAVRLMTSSVPSYDTVGPKNREGNVCAKQQERLRSSTHRRRSRQLHSSVSEIMHRSSMS